MTDQTERRTIAERVVAANNGGDIQTLMTELYSPQCASAEGVQMEDGPPRIVEGTDAITVKWDWWGSAHEVHSATAKGPFLHGENQFGVVFSIDATDKASGQRMQMEELGIYTVEGGKIVREEFFC